MTASASTQIERLIAFACKNELIATSDIVYCRNLLLDALNMPEPDGDMNAEELTTSGLPVTATPMLQNLCDEAMRRGMISGSLEECEHFEARLMGLLSPLPSTIQSDFYRIEENHGALAATDWFYRLCRASNYIRVDDIARNIRYFSETTAGKLEITINLSKPEKDPRDITAALNASTVNYPSCALCRENVGYAGRAGFSARQNLRTLPMSLAGEPWHFQFSPYLYYEEHCIVFRHEHTPMGVTPDVFSRLFDFVRRFPHYFIGANAGLPIVGGSILSHDHFQGGRHTFPIDRAEAQIQLKSSAYESVEVTVPAWPLPSVCLCGPREAVETLARQILSAWQGHSDAALDVIAHTGDTSHNAITPIARVENGRYSLTLILRNNRTTNEFPMGIFHPHEPLHHIKKENIGLIEAMGCFILPGRLAAELVPAVAVLAGEDPLQNNYSESHPLHKHAVWLAEVVSRHGTSLSQAEAADAINAEVGEVCAQVLRDAGVYKQTPEGRQGLLRFLRVAGLEPC